MRDCVVQGVPVVVADTADYIRSAGVQPVTSLNAIRPPEAFCFGREKEVLKENAGKCCGPSVAISPGYVNWAKYKEYKSSVTSYFYIGLVFGCIDAGLCK